MPLDLGAERILAVLAPLPKSHDLSVVEARAALEHGRMGVGSPFGHPFGDAEAVAAIDDRTIPGPENEIRLRIYRPAGDGPFGVFVHVHGGGFFAGSLEMVERESRAFARGARCIVVAFDYRLAPEHRFPAALEDCWAVLTWVARHAQTFDGDPARLAIGGDSAGANLAAATALQARDEGVPPLKLQLLLCPSLDFGLGHPSVEENGDVGIVTKAEAIWARTQYLRNERDADDPRASPLRAQSLRGLAPTFIMTAEYDVFRDEGEEYARRLEQSGVPVEAKCWAGMPHVFHTMAAFLPAGREAFHTATAALRGVLAPPERPSELDFPAK